MELKKFLVISCICFSSSFGSNEVINVENHQQEKHWFSEIYKTMEEAKYELSQHTNLKGMLQIRKYGEDKFGFYAKNIKFPFSRTYICQNKKRFYFELHKRYQNLLSSGDVNIIFDNEFELINWYELSFFSFEYAHFELNQHPEIAEYFDVVEYIANDYSCWKIMLKSEIQEIYSYHNGLTTDYLQLSVKEYLKTHKSVTNKRGIPLVLVKTINKQLIFEDNRWKMKVISEK